MRPVPHTLATLALPLAVALLAARCGEEPNEPEAGAEGEAGPAVVETRPLTDGLALWRAQGFTLLVPSDADIVPQRPTPPATWAAILAGPGFIQEGEDGTPRPGPPAYRLDAFVYAKPDTVPLERWVAARLAERGEETARRGEIVPVAGEAAFRTGASPREAGPASYWLERDGAVVEFRLEEEPESPLGALQRHVQSLLLSTFRWSGDSAAR